MHGQQEWSTGTPHTLLGFFVFGLGFVIYLGILWILDHLYVEEASDEAGVSMGGRR
jgi:hypothetical protein